MVKDTIWRKKDEEKSFIFYIIFNLTIHMAVKPELTLLDTT